MSNYTVFSSPSYLERDQSYSNLVQESEARDAEANPLLPPLITKSASKQTYYTIRFLVDRDRIGDAYRAYAYFRWVDDYLDEKLSVKSERLAFVERQQTLMNCVYHGEVLPDVAAEERILMDLIRSDQEPSSGLQSYIRNMMAVMTFDAERRGRLISRRELTEYSDHLSTAVTEALHYFIGHDDPSPQIPSRNLAVTGAHITHMLRDTFEDIVAGYFNIPQEFLEAQGIGAGDVESDAYRSWVEGRVQFARNCFETGKSYLRQVKNLRCRIAGYAYTARFEEVLNAIERDGYRIRPAYPERKSLRDDLRMSWSILSMMFKGLVRGKS